jgi:PAP2 superfamily protein
MPPGRTDPACVMAGAVREVTDYLFRSIYPDGDRLSIVFSDQVFLRRAAGVPAGIVSASLDHGVRLGRALVAWIAADGYAGTVGRPYSPPVGESLWRPSPPNFGVAISPYWSEVRPMVLRRADEVTPVAHVPYSASVGSPFWQQANTTYQTGLALTQWQRETAMFWRDNPHTSGLPSGHWMQIVRQVCEQQQLSLARSVEAYVRAGVALHDAFLNCWTWKYRYNLIRPVDYGHLHIDPNWETWVATPAFPEYTSGHSVASAAASHVLTDLLGNLAFSDENSIPEWGTRQFASFREAAQQAATSRLYGGIHYPMAIEAGLDQGDAIGSLVVDRLQTRR